MEGSNKCREYDELVSTLCNHLKSIMIRIEGLVSEGKNPFESSEIKDLIGVGLNLKKKISEIEVPIRDVYASYLRQMIGVLRMKFKNETLTGALQIKTRSEYLADKKEQEEEAMIARREDRLSQLKKYNEKLRKGENWFVKALAFSDLHGNTMTHLHPERYDVAFVAGDICPKLEGGPDSYAEWVSSVFCKWCEEYQKTEFVLVEGDCDLFTSSTKPIKWPKNVHFLDNAGINIKGISVYGTSWNAPPSLRQKMACKKSAAKMREELESISDRYQVILSHLPPAIDGNDIDLAADQETHVGCKELTEIMEGKKFSSYWRELMICGHAHGGNGRTANIGTMKTENVSILGVENKPCGFPLEFLFAQNKVIVKPRSFCGDIDDFARKNEPQLEFDDYFKDGGDHPRRMYCYRYFRGEDACPFETEPESAFWFYEKNIATKVGPGWVSRWLFDHTTPSYWPDFIKDSTAAATDREMALFICEQHCRATEGVPAEVKFRNEHFGVDYAPEIDWSKYFQGEFLNLGDVSVKSRFRYYAGEEESPFSGIYDRFWHLEKNLLGFPDPDKSIRGFFDSTLPVRWPRFMEGVHAPYLDMALIYFFWLDYDGHVYGGDEGGAEWLHYFDYPLVSERKAVVDTNAVNTIKILAMADLHGGGLKDLNLEGCDMLVLAGDICPDAVKESPAGEWKYEGRKTKLEWLEDCFFNWCREHSDIKIVLTLGNRDKFILEKPLDKIEWPDNVTCLVDEMKVVNGIKFYGTPWVSIKKDLLAAGYRGNGVYEGTPIDLRVNYEKIPAGVDILICHETPAGVDSEINVGIDRNTGKPIRYGSDILAEQIRRACPKLVLCGHIHAASHRISHLKDHFDTTIINVSRPIGYDRRGLLKAAEPRVIEVAKRNGDVEIRPVYNEMLDGHQFREIFTAGEYYADTCPFEKDTVEADFWELEFSVLNSYGLNADEMDRKGAQMLRRKQCPREIRDADWPEWAKVQAAAMYDLADDWDDEQDKRDLATGMGDPDRPLYVNLPWGDYFKGPEK